METITVRMEYLKSTKNTHRYEVAEDEKGDDGRAPIDTIYIRHAEMGPNPPQSVIVQVTPDSS